MRGGAGTTRSAVFTHSAGTVIPNRRALSRFTERRVLVAARNGICAGFLPWISSATMRPASRPLSAKSVPTPRTAPAFTYNGENVKSGTLAISQARAIAGNDELVRLSEIWQKTSTPDWQSVRAASLTSDGPFAGRLLSSMPSRLERLFEFLPGHGGVDFRRIEQRADPTGPGQDQADRAGHLCVGENKVGAGHVRPVVRG